MKEKIEHWFTFHQPAAEVGKACGKVREAGKDFALVVDELVPDSADKAAAVRKIREAVQTAVAGIVCEGR